MTTKQNATNLRRLRPCGTVSSSIPQGQIIVIQNKICMHEYCLAYAQLEAGGIGEKPGSFRKVSQPNCNAETIAYLTGQSLFLCERHSVGVLRSSYSGDLITGTKRISTIVV